MAPHNAVRQVKELAEDHIEGTPIVTESNRWIRLTVYGRWDGLGTLKQELRKLGYRVKDHSSQCAKLKITKQGVQWPHQQR